ncbi:response regulator [Geminocystis sp. NIES-3709]|uniref:response regulator n=1 Tax=Geminocystis sp. NIES-3709 TaxID=1617448 RepID=UPI0005FC410E|nr:response regulator [Geminocystis sp. NIES-3709]BAQ65794.1 two-component system response regulator [Geminocystis sp. NIES-3709]
MVLKPLEILLVEDSLSDVILMKKMLKQTLTPKILHVAKDGIEAMNFLHQKGEYEKQHRPDLILLDLNLPRKNGKEVLKEIKSDLELKAIPVIVLTTSEEDKDIIECYQDHANCYLTKPIDLRDFYKCVTAIDNFWFQFVRYPVNY